MASKTIKGLTVEIGGDTTKLGKAIKDVEAKSRSLSKELGDINNLLKLDPGNVDLLAQKQEVLGQAAEAAAKKLETLKEAEKQVQAQFERGEASEEQLRALQREIVSTENKMKGYQKAAQQTAEQIKELGDNAGKAGDNLDETGSNAKKSSKKVDEFGDAAEKAEKSSSSLGETLSGAVKAGLAAVAAAATAAITGLVAAAESTREYRTEMGKLDTAFTQNGFSAEAAHSAYQALQGVLGETDQSVEAANHLAKLTDNEKDLATWTGDILPGVFATFGDSLPIEGLTEAANETAKVGQVTGPLADALNWAGVSEDNFNESLAACTTEQERQALITETLAGLYKGAAAAYKETNAEVIRANQANDAWMQSMAGVGAAVEPIITDVKMLGASLLADAVPAVQNLAAAFRGVMNGEDGAADQFGAALSGLLSSLVQKLIQLLPTMAQVAISLISTLVTTLVGQLPQILSTGGQIIGKLLEGIVAALPSVAQKALDVISGFVTGLQTYLPLVLAKGAELLSNLTKGIAQNLPNLISQALDIVMRFAQTIYDNAPTLISAGLDALSNLVQGIMDSLPVLLAKGPEIISKFANVINDNFPTILAKGVQLIGQIIMGIIKAIPTLIANIPKIITAIVDVWEAFNWLNLGKNAIKFLKDGILKMVGAVKNAGTSIMNAAANGLKNLPSKLMSLGKNAISNLGGTLKSGASTVASGAKAIFNGVVNTIKGLPSKMLSIGGDLVKGLWNGISDMTGWVINKIKGFGESVLGGIKSFFGIHSPSRVFRDEVGAMLARGMAEGIEDNADAPMGAMSGLSKDLLSEAEGLNGITLERRLQNTFSAPAPAATAESGLLEKLDKILAAVEKGQILTLDSKQLVGGTATMYDNTLGQRRALAARGAL